MTDPADATWPAPDVMEWVARQGWSVRRAAAELGCSRDALAKWMREGAPRYIGLAASALSGGQGMWRSPD